MGLVPSLIIFSFKNFGEVESIESDSVWGSISTPFEGVC